MSGRRHPSPEQILDWLASGKPAEPGVEAHFDVCARCLTIMREGERLLAGLRDAHLPQVPAELVERTLASVLREYQHSVETGQRGSDVRSGSSHLLARLRDLQPVLSELHAILIRDSLVPDPILRGAQPQLRTLLYEAPGFTIAFQAPVAMVDHEVFGQVSPASGARLPSGGTAILRGGSTQIETEVSELGTFSIESVPAGEYELEVTLTGVRIRLEVVVGGD